jgi:hypothetical protein
MIPWFSYWNNSRSVGTSLTWYHYKLFGFEKGILWEEGLPGVKKSAWDKLTLSVDTGFYRDTIILAFNMAYDATNKNTTLAGAIRFAPGDHWRWMVVYQQINQVKNSAGQDVGRYQNQLIFSMRYEF